MKRPRIVRGAAGRGSKHFVTGPSSQVGINATSTRPDAALINPKWAWHYRVLLALRERLLQERREHLTAAAQPLEPHSMSAADSASDEFDHNLALAVLSAEQDALHEIDAAISRIYNGTYGVCEASGQPIPNARLKALPWARFTRAIEEQQEAAGAIRATRLGALQSIRGLSASDREAKPAPGQTAPDEISGPEEDSAHSPAARPEGSISATKSKPET